MATKKKAKPVKKTTKSKVKKKPAKKKTQPPTKVGTTQYLHNPDLLPDTWVKAVVKIIDSTRGSHKSTVGSDLKSVGYNTSTYDVTGIALLLIKYKDQHPAIVRMQRVESEHDAKLIVCFQSVGETTSRIERAYFTYSDNLVLHIPSEHLSLSADDQPYSMQLLIRQILIDAIKLVYPRFVSHPVEVTAVRVLSHGNSIPTSDALLWLKHANHTDTVYTPTMTVDDHGTVVGSLGGPAMQLCTNNGQVGFVNSWPSKEFPADFYPLKGELTDEPCYRLKVVRGRIMDAMPSQHHSSFPTESINITDESERDIYLVMAPDGDVILRLCQRSPAEQFIYFVLTEEIGSDRYDLSEMFIQYGGLSGLLNELNRPTNNIDQSVGGYNIAMSGFSDKRTSVCISGRNLVMRGGQLVFLTFNLTNKLVAAKLHRHLNRFPNSDEP